MNNFDQEHQLEQNIIKTLRSFYIRSSVKTDKYTLPYQHSISMCFKFKMDKWGSYDQVNRYILKELLDKNIKKIRFYTIIDYSIQNMLNKKVHVEFRYYIHR